MKSVLWISLRAPYDKVPHAGGKVHNYYLKNFHKSEKFHLSLISFCYEREVNDLDLTAYGIENHVAVIKQNPGVRSLLDKLGLPISLLEYGFVIRTIKEQLKKLKQQEYKPEVIILQWTEIIMLYPYVQKMFPNVPVVAIEEDVTFLKMQRKLERSKGIKKLITLAQKVSIEKKELFALKNAELIVLNNPKDYKLVCSRGVEENKSFIAIPFFNNMSKSLQRSPQKGEILFWGAMNRPENIEAVQWFITNVLEKIRCKDEKTPFHFTILGANPPEEIKALNGKNLDNGNSITVTGFVDDPTDYFANCMCMVVPLLMGAGVKIKVLEGLSAGIPVLTNQLGIEGIPAVNGESYFHCETPEEYISKLHCLMDEDSLVNQIGDNAREYILANYDMQDNIMRFIERVDHLS